MSDQDYNTAARLPLSAVRDPQYHDLLRRYAQLSCRAVRDSLLAAIKEPRL